MSNCAKCGRYFETSKQTDYCSECERPKISTCDMPLPGVGKQEGWICPVCGRGLSPWTSFCPCQSDWKITYGTGLDNVYKICTPDTDTMKFIDEQRNKLYETLGIPKDLLEG